MDDDLLQAAGISGEIGAALTPTASRFDFLAQLLEKARSFPNPYFARTLEGFLDVFDEVGGKVYAGQVDAQRFWAPDQQVAIVDGNLRVSGNMITGEMGLRDCFLVVLGDIVCDNLLAISGSTTLCTGDLEVKDLMVTATTDSAFYQFGRSRIRALYSGHGAGCLSTYNDDIEVDLLDGYIADGRRWGAPHTAGAVQSRGSAIGLLVAELVNDEQWSRLSEQEQIECIEAGESRDDYCRIDLPVLRQRLRGGDSLLVS